MYVKRVYLVVPVFITALLFISAAFGTGAVGAQSSRFISAGRGVEGNLQSTNWGGYVIASNQTALNDYNAAYAKP
ncbi:MAG: hypothetical protein ACP5UH_01800, partial [Candidatus Micrarchaeia archaeon]